MAFSILHLPPLITLPASSSSSRQPRPPPFKNSSSHAVFCVNSGSRRAPSRAAVLSLSVRCEQSANQGGGADVWVGRLAMVSFVTAVTVEVSTGKGLLENLGVATPAPTLALAVTALVVGLVAFFIFQASSRD